MAVQPGSEMTNLLSRFGVDYQNAPAPTPATLAFMRGLGLSLDTAADAKAKTVGRIKDRTTTALGDIDRGNERTKTNMLADLVRRGVLRSGEADKRYGQQAENVASQKSGVLRSQAEGIDAADAGYNSVRDSLRTRALEGTLSAETDQANRKAATDAQAESYRRQDEAAAKADADRRAADEAYLRQQEDLLRRFGAGR